MKKLSKRRIITLLLALTMIFTALPINLVGANARTYESTGSNYGAVIGNTAGFNKTEHDVFLVDDEPASYVSGTQISEEQSLWAYDIPDNLLLVIIDYYYDNGANCLWYKVEAAHGYVLPEKLQQNPWVFQKWFSLPEYPDCLIVDEGGRNFVTDENGSTVAEIRLTSENTYKEITADSTLQGAVKYQWQVFVNNIWIDIYGENEAELKVSPGVVATILDDNLCAKVRVVSASGSKTVEGDAITVVVEPYAENIASAYSLRSANVNDVIMLTEGDETVSNTVNVTVKYVYGSNGETVAADRIYNIQQGGSVTDTFDLPKMEGYNAYLEEDTENIYETYSLNLTDVTADTVIIFKYWPAKVNYTVIYYLQNADNDNYTEHYRYTETDFTGNIASVDDLTFDGFYQLLYEAVPVASDGSTVIEVYYDRLYYKMTFNLDGGYGVQPIYARYGTEIDVPSPTKAGYTFVGWDDVTSGTGDGIADTLPDSVPAYHSAYKAIWQVNDSAKLTIVYWGENADDELYSYIKSQEVMVKPGTELTFGTDQLICSLTEHTHGDDCSYICGKEVHEHSLANGCYTLTCTENSHSHSESGCTVSCSHTHTTDCYKVGFGSGFYSLISTSQPTASNLTNTGNGIYTYTTTTSGIVGGTATHYYLNIGDEWYCAGRRSNTNDETEISLNCTHAHDDSCYTCGKIEGTHTHSIEGGCYTLNCTTEVHTHTDDCYSCVEHQHTDSCYLKTESLDSTLWTFNEADTVTVAADGSTVMNVYYDRTTFTLTFNYNYSNRNYQSTSTVTDKWGADISTRFLAVSDSAKGNLWSEESSGDSPWTSYLQIMPQRNVDYYCNITSTTTQPAYYYTQNLDGTYSLAYTVNAYYGNSLTISKEDFYEMEGFTYDHGEDGDGDSMPYPDSYGSWKGAKFYYTRNSYTVDFHSGDSTVRTEIELYEAPLSEYSSYKLDASQAPAKYEPGSVQFAGWYLNPECTGNQVDFTNMTMPANNLIVYAKWEPVVHTVRFFLDETLEFTDENVYTVTVDGTEIKYLYDDIKHGDTVQDSHTPPNDPTKGQYIFVGWFYIDANGNEQMWDFENTTVTRDTDIYAKWSSNTLVPYTVKFVYKDASGKEIEIADPITGCALGGNSKTFEAKGNEQLYSGYQAGYFPTVQSHTIVMDLEDPTKNTFTFYYKKLDAVPYTVHYYLAGTATPVAESKIVSDNDKAVVTETYVKVPGYLPNTYQQNLIIDPDGTNEIIFYYTKDDKNGMYVVHYWTENLDGTYSEHSIFEGRGEKDSTVTAMVKAIENFTYDENHSKEKLSGQISTDEVLELHVYYKRNPYPYKVQYLEEGTNKALSREKVVTGKLWEEIVTETAIVISDYTLVGNTESSIQIRKDTDNPTVNVITFYYTENKVTINYEVAAGNGTVTPVSETVKILNGVANGSIAAAGDGYRFVGWYSDKDCTNLISNELKYIPTKADGGKWGDGTTFYAKFEPDNATLTLRKVYPAGADYSMDENQTFIFSIKGKDGTETAGIDLTVTIHGAGEITVTDLPIGEYTVTEQTDWSWRYTAQGDGSDREVKLSPDETNEVTFENMRDEHKWLDGNDSAVNIFGGKAD